MTTIGKITATQAKMDSKGGTWQHAGGMLQPPWLFRRKAIPFESTQKKDTREGVFLLGLRALRVLCPPEITSAFSRFH